jgi:hypothetical protein
MDEFFDKSMISILPCAVLFCEHRLFLFATAATAPHVVRVALNIDNEN